MADDGPQFLDVGTGESRRRIAYLLDPPARDEEDGLVWLSGFNSEMVGIKASALAAWARGAGLGCLRFDYSGHGRSEGRLEDGSIGRWLEETRWAFCRLTRGPQVLVGSSMGGYLALLLLKALLAEEPAQARRIGALVLIAPAWDMTELIWQRLSAAARSEIASAGIHHRPSRYGDGPYPITRALIEEGRRHLIADAPFGPGRPVAILHGLRDEDVPWEHTLKLLGQLPRRWTHAYPVADGDHRLSRPQDIARLLEIVGELVRGLKRGPT